MKRIPKYLPPLLATIVFSSLLLLDFVAPYIQSFGDLEFCESYVIIDVYGMLKNTTIATNRCYKAGMSLNELRALGKLKAERIIIVTHFFSSNGVYGLGTSDPVSLWTPLQHLLLFPFLVKGITPEGSKYVAVTPVALRFSTGYEGKELILITCPLSGIESFASAFTGAKTVAITARDVTANNVEHYVHLALSTNSVEDLCQGGEFKCR